VADPQRMIDDARPAADFVAALTLEIRRHFGDDLVGLYVYGSWVTGGFDPEVSDVDIVAVSSQEARSLDIASLGHMHDALIDRFPEWTDRLEIVYVGRATLRSFRTSHGSLAVVSPGEPLHIRDERPADWLQNWYLVRETGVCLFGADVSAIIPAISWDEFAAATVRYADELRDRSRLDANGDAVAYTVLTMCRALRVARTQTLGSKQEAASWARDRMPEWAWLIDAALECRLSRGTIGLDDETSRAAAETFIALLADEIHR
jgi:predicted nucleotidyltransferase